MTSYCLLTQAVTGMTRLVTELADKVYADVPQGAGSPAKRKVLVWPILSNIVSIVIFISFFNRQSPRPRHRHQHTHAHAHAHAHEHAHAHAHAHANALLLLLVLLLLFDIVLLGLLC